MIFPHLSTWFSTVKATFFHKKQAKMTGILSKFLFYFLLYVLSYYQKNKNSSFAIQENTWHFLRFMVTYKPLTVFWSFSVRNLLYAAVLEQADRHVWGACARAYGFKSRLPHQNLGVCDISVFQGFLFFIIFYKKCRTECYYDTITTLVPFFSINKN